MTKPYQISVTWPPHCWGACLCCFLKMYYNSRSCYVFIFSLNPSLSEGARQESCPCNLRLRFLCCTKRLSASPWQTCKILRWEVRYFRACGYHSTGSQINIWKRVIICSIWTQFSFRVFQQLILNLLLSPFLMSCLESQQQTGSSVGHPGCILSSTATSGCSRHQDK